MKEAPMALVNFELMAGPMDGAIMGRWENEITHSFMEVTRDGPRWHIYIRKDKLPRLYYVKTEREEDPKGGKK